MEDTCKKLLEDKEFVFGSKDKDEDKIIYNFEITDLVAINSPDINVPCLELSFKVKDT